jgi:hypothetical protein
MRGESVFDLLAYKTAEFADSGLTKSKSAAPSLADDEPNHPMI